MEHGDIGITNVIKPGGKGMTAILNSCVMAGIETGSVCVFIDGKEINAYEKKKAASRLRLIFFGGQK